jgi:hypothetical protein
MTPSKPEPTSSGRRICAECSRVTVVAGLGRQETGFSEEETCNSRSSGMHETVAPTAAPARPVPCNDATGRVRPITPEEQVKKARALAAFVEKMLAMPDEDPPGAWEEAMRDLDAHRPHRKLFEGLY